MNRTICVFSDESGVFDRNRDDFFVFGGLVLDAGKREPSDVANLFSDMEAKMRMKPEYSNVNELKATSLSFQDRRRMFSILKPFHKFGVIITLDNVLDRIFTSRKSKQRYQDYAYKIGLKNALKELIRIGMLNVDDSLRFSIVVDQHQTATDGRYELEEGLLMELKEGTYNMRFDKYFEPLFRNTESLKVVLADSKDNVLIRAADIIANRVYFEANNNSVRNLENMNMTITSLP